MILSIMMMLSLGIITLTHLGQQLTNALTLTAHEYRYLKARQMAESSLNWGLHQVWPPTVGKTWLCQHANIAFSGYPPRRLYSCVRPSLRDGVFLLKGEGATGDNSLPLVVFQQAKVLGSPEGGRKFIALEQGWLDFCPESDADYCER